MCFYEIFILKFQNNKDFSRMNISSRQNYKLKVLLTKFRFKSFTTEI